MSHAPFRERRAVPRLKDPDPAELQERFFDPGLPCVLAGVHASADLAAWMAGLERCRDVVPCVVARSRNISRISDADRPPVAEAGRMPEVGEFAAELPLAEAWGRIRDPSAHAPIVAPGESVYVIEATVPPDLDFPPVVPATPLAERLFADRRTRHLIVNMPGMINRNHAHVHEVLLHQVHARKRVRLFSPADTPRLYPNAERRSEVPDFDHVDLARFPRVAGTVAWETVLEPGDVLFLPSYWWHEIRVDEAAVSIGSTVEAGRWARQAFAFHRVLADALAELDGADDEARAAGMAAIVLATAASTLDAEGLATTISSFRYEYM
jgi:hypothetical protein